MKVIVEPLKYARIKSIVLGLASVGFIIIMTYCGLAAIKRHEDFNYWLWVASFVPVYLILVKMPIEKAYEVSGDNEIERYVRIGWRKFNAEKFPRPMADQVLIRQDAERYYYLVLTYGNGNEHALGRYPVLKEANLWLEVFRVNLCYP